MVTGRRMRQHLVSGDALIIPSAVDFLGREIISDSLWKIIPEEGLRVDGDTQELNVKPLPRNEGSNTHLQIRIIRELV